MSEIRLKKPSINAIETAKEVSETIRTGKPVNLGKIIAKRYSKSTSKSPQRVTETESYKSVINPVIEQMEKERLAILARLPKVRSRAKYRDLIDGLDKTTKNIQLLGGKPTEISSLDEETKKRIEEILS